MSMPKSMKNQVEGLCGNYNYNEFDEFTDEQGKKLSREEFPSSWVVETPPEVKITIDARTSFRHN